jgi:hypothetical protein
MRHGGRDIENWEGSKENMPHYFGNNVICDCIAGATHFDSSVSRGWKGNFCFVFVTILILLLKGILELKRGN